jgi:phosphatidylserine/phosphatidylglycerophosphate/cardiolipin synthase-like enzyme
MTLAFFSEIKDVIIKLIDTSKSEISIAVAWFTHRDLYQALLNALDRNVQVSIILIDDIINRGPNALDFTLFINKGGKVRFMNTKKILMHNKFCIFDKEALITGSYNWTYSAELRNTLNRITRPFNLNCIIIRMELPMPTHDYNLQWVRGQRQKVKGWLGVR